MNESYAVGAVLGQIEATAGGGGASGPGCSGAGENRRHRPHFRRRTRNGSKNRVQPTVRGLPVPANAAGASYLSPRLKARMNELGLHAADLAGVAGSGAAGRVTVEDFERFIATSGKTKDHARRRPCAWRWPTRCGAVGRGRWRTSGMPVCLDPLFAHRKVARPKPGPALCALRALAVALAENSAPAGRLVGSKIVHPSSIDIGFAVEAEDGVLVPVIRNADKTIAEGFDRALQRTGGTGARTQIAGGRHRRFHRHRHELRHVRPGMGHADSAAGTDAGAGHGRGAARAAVGIRSKASSCR